MVLILYQVFRFTLWLEVGKVTFVVSIFADDRCIVETPSCHFHRYHLRLSAFTNLCIIFCTEETEENGQFRY